MSIVVVCDDDLCFKCMERIAVDNVIVYCQQCIDELGEVPTEAIQSSATAASAKARVKFPTRSFSPEFEMDCGV